MNESNENKDLFEFTDEEKNTVVEYRAGEEAPLADGVSEADFGFVQQDKSIHDVKFTTKPTTFFRDAMRRFAKNRSSVAGGIILGILFILAFILPIEGVLPYDVQSVHNYEGSLPPKVFNVGTGFWDGTRTYTNQALPYDSTTNEWVGNYPEAALISVDNVRQSYADVLTEDGTGGYVALVRDANPKLEEGETTSVVGGYLYSYAYTYDLQNTYTISYTLGWRDEADTIQPKYDILFRIGNTFYPLTDYSLSYGELGAKDNAEMTVAPYATEELNLTDLLLNCEALMEDYPDATTLNGNVGFCFREDADNATALYLHDFTITSTSESSREQAQMRNRSFSDATELLNRPQRTSGNQYNTGYWAGNGSTGLFPADSLSTRCDITYDMYEAVYGYRTDLPALNYSVMQGWIDKGYVTYTAGDPESFSVTQEGEASGEVYVRKVISDTPDGATRNLQCEMLTWKWLGYDEMPIHVFGTDPDGRDILKYSFEGLRNSLLIGIAVAIINIFIGVVWGSISGYFGGKVDLTMERIVDILAGIPWIVLMTVLCIKLGQTFFVFILALTLTGWIGTESITRSQFYRYRGREYVLASKTLGAKAPRLIFRHILPNAIGTIVTSSVLIIPSVIFNEATISYLGLGFQGMSSLGVILSRYQDTLRQFPYQLAVPAIIIALLMICFNLFGNGLRDAFNPSLKGTD